MAVSTEIRSNLPEITVSELSANLKRTIEDAFGYVRLRGEVLNYKGPHSSGHVYFCLKDEGARIDAVIWKGNFSRLRFRPEEGLEVIATGRITTYPGKSTYQIIVENIEPAGVGALMALLEERRKKLAAEGLFDEARKRPLPYLPSVVGIVTSPTGAVIRDILHRLSDRFPRNVLLWSVRVQGDTCAAEVTAAIEGFNALANGGKTPSPDVLIVARGGGALEDLWGFNEEIVVRAAVASKIPLVSAIGHETDFTLLDFAADRRAPTPTAAAEMIVPVRAELMVSIGNFAARLVGSAARFFERLKSEVRGLARGIPAADALLALPRQRLDAAHARLPRALRANAHAHRVEFARLAAHHRPQALRARLTQLRERFDSLAARGKRAFDVTAETRASRFASIGKLLEAFSYHGVLERGFALVRDAEGRPLRSAKAVSVSDVLDIEFADGRVPAVATGGSPRRPRGGPKSGGQGSLFG
jgi:exodeoxyribonuclease VII large subunit